MSCATPKQQIDELYLRDPYYIVPDGDVGQQAFAVIREAIRKEGMVAVGKVVFTSREHIIALQARGKGMVGATLRYPYEVRNEDEYFDGIEDETVPKDMLDLAVHIVDTKRGNREGRCRASIEIPHRSSIRAAISLERADPSRHRGIS